MPLLVKFNKVKRLLQFTLEIYTFWHILHTSLLRFSCNSRFYPQQLLCLCFCHLLRRHKFLISEHETEMPYSRSHACLPCDLLCAHIAALRSKKSVSIPPCGKCSVNLSRLRYRLLTAWHFCFPGLFTNAKCGCWQYMPRKIPDTKENVRPFDSGILLHKNAPEPI